MRIRQIAITLILISMLTFSATAKNTTLDIYEVKPITNKRILPDSNSIPGQISDTISIVAAPGEYEPISFAIHAKADIESLTLQITDLKTNKGQTIPASAIDAKVIKCWYQDTGNGYKEKTPAELYNPIDRSGVKVLLPELLLNDDSLIKIEGEHNYMRIKGKYVCISKPEGILKESGVLYNRYDWGKDLVIEDAKTL